jgi:hypothetical protein
MGIKFWLGETVLIELTCKFCGKKYEAIKDYSSYITTKRKYCSRKCSYAGQKRDKNWRDGTFCIKSQRNLCEY